MIATPRHLVSSDGSRLTLTIGREYEVLGIESDFYRLLDDCDDPVLFAPEDLPVVDASEPHFWKSWIGADGERHAYPSGWDRPGFFEDYFDRVAQVRDTFWGTLRLLYPKTANRPAG